MASNVELVGLWKEDSQLQYKVVAAIWKAAHAISGEAPATPNHAERLIWAKAAFLSAEAKAVEMLPYLLAENEGLTKAQISAASDAAVQSAVDSAVNLFAV